MFSIKNKYMLFVEDLDDDLFEDEIEQSETLLQHKFVTCFLCGDVFRAKNIEDYFCSECRCCDIYSNS